MTSASPFLGTTVEKANASGDRWGRHIFGARPLTSLNDRCLLDPSPRYALAVLVGEAVHACFHSYDHERVLEPRSRGAGRLLPQELLDRGRSPYRSAMFKIVLQPEEDAVLCAIRDGLCPALVVPEPVLLKLIALRMVRCDEHGNPSLTDLAEAALARMRGKIH